MSEDPKDQERRIQQRAYDLWEANGRRDGEHEEHWHRARTELEGERSGSLDDQLADSFPASDPAALTSPSRETMALPAAAEDEPVPAYSATLEELPTDTVKPAAKPRASRAKKKLV
jgi:hypothetical protein